MASEVLVNIGSGLLPSQLQAITWTYADFVHCSLTVTLRNKFQWNFNQNAAISINSFCPGDIDLGHHWLR